MKRSSAPRAQHRRRPAVAGRDQVAVEVHRALRLAGGARRECDQRRVFGGRVDRGERRRLARHAHVELVGIAAAEVTTDASSRTVRDAPPRARRRAARRTARARSAPWSTISVSSLARSSGIVPTAMPPAFSTANQHAACSGVFGERSSTRLPGTRPRSSTSTRAMRLARSSSRRRSSDVRPAR